MFLDPEVKKVLDLRLAKGELSMQEYHELLNSLIRTNKENSEQESPKASVSKSAENFKNIESDDISLTANNNRKSERKGKPNWLILLMVFLISIAVSLTILLGYIFIVDLLNTRNVFLFSLITATFGITTGYLQTHIIDKAYVKHSIWVTLVLLTTIFSSYVLWRIYQHYQDYYQNYPFLSYAWSSLFSVIPPVLYIAFFLGMIGIVLGSYLKNLKK